MLIVSHHEHRVCVRAADRPGGPRRVNTTAYPSVATGNHCGGPRPTVTSVAVSPAHHWDWHTCRISLSVTDPFGKPCTTVRGYVVMFYPSTCSLYILICPSAFTPLASLFCVKPSKQLCLKQSKATSQYIQVPFLSI